MSETSNITEHKGSGILDTPTADKVANVAAFGNMLVELQDLSARKQTELSPAVTEASSERSSEAQYLKPSDILRYKGTDLKKREDTISKVTSVEPNNKILTNREAIKAADSSRPGLGSNSVPTGPAR